MVSFHTLSPLSRLINLLPFVFLSLSALTDAQNVHDKSFVPDTVLRVSKSTVDISCTQRETVLVNGTTPGPLVQLEPGKTTWVRVYNDIPDSNTTIHWHGLSASVAPFSDGTPLASQWPIPPLHYFDYELHPNKNESGSYFYHSHVEFQAVSAAGPLIVADANKDKPPYTADYDRIFFISELYNKSDDAIVDGLIGAPFVWSGEPESLLVNGHATPVTNKTNDKCAPEVFEVEPSKTYRFRFIGGVALTDTFIAVEDHKNLTVIAADAGYTKPVSTDHMQVDSGQRFDVLLETKSLAELSKNGTTQSDYWIQLQTAYRPSIVPGWALLRYKLNGTASNCTGFCYTPGTARSVTPSVGKPTNISAQIPAIGDNTTNTWLEYALSPLVPLKDFPSASEVTRRIYLSMVQLQLKNGQSPIDINNATWVAEVANSTYESAPRSQPYLVDIYTQGQSAVPSIQSADDYYNQQKAANPAALYTGWDPAFNAYPFAVGEVIEVVLLNEDGFAGNADVHPWHAHGRHYFDLGSGPGMYDAAANEAKLAALRKKSGFTPALRDSTMVYRWPANNNVNNTERTVTGWRAWRLRINDPGVWMVHCHTLQHMIMGMQTVFVMGNASQITQRGLPESAGYDVYGQSVSGQPGANGSHTHARGAGAYEGYMSFGGAAYGNEERAPVVAHYFGDD